ncbi:MAG: DUF4843 domain-containing protein, partial [Odoribacter sp.]|nr:DUF4843 domain-containing protein [Odoribacter sp.]
CSMICSCSEEYMSFEGTDRIQFKTKTEEVYTFAYYPESIQKDTLQIELISVGEVTDYPRVIRFEQVTKEWKYTYDEEEPEKVVDSTYVDMEFPAVAGVHYESLGEKNELILPANQNVLKLNVIIKREDTGLRKNARKLVLRLLPSDDFQTGEVNKLVKNITISDKLERPTRWKDNSYYYKLYLGNWSEVKHRFMIDITGQKWDNDFLVYIIDNYDTYSLRDYYLAKIKKALAEYNADPKNDPPLKDENGKEVVFP